MQVKLNSSVCNNKQNWNKNKCKCECKKLENIIKDLVGILVIVLVNLKRKQLIY